MTDDRSAVLSTYVAAWCETNQETRDKLIASCWDTNAVYCDPSAHVTGGVALSAHITGVQIQFPGAKIVLTSGLDLHHNRGHFTWQMVLSDGTAAVDGRDVVRFAANGRLAEVVGFFGPPPPLPR